MKRTPEQWRNCDPNYMAVNQSSCAISHALADAKADILELVAEVERLRAAAVPANEQEEFEKRFPVPKGMRRSLHGYELHDDQPEISAEFFYGYRKLWSAWQARASLAAAPQPPTASAQACRPEDRAMLQTDAGREMVAAAVAAMEKPAGADGE